MPLCSRCMLVACLLVRIAFAASSAGEPKKVPWDLKRLAQTPVTHSASFPKAEGISAIFYDGLPWRGKPTRVFTWYGAPKTRNAERVPAMVLVHGGGGTAFAEWVKRWNDRGYAAIAMDTCGSVPFKDYGEPGGANGRPRHRFSGPPGWDATFDQVNWPINDQWPYHAVADIVLANSLLRSFPEVDPQRIGITGISWGGYLTSIAASVDQRFRLAIPVYGCGFLGEDSYWVPELKHMGAAESRKWLGLWDPSEYLGQAKIPFLWVAGTNDFAYPMDSLQRSYRLPQAPRELAIRVRMRHGQQAGEAPEEIYAFADQYLHSGPPLPSVRDQGRSGGQAWLRYSAKIPVVSAELNYTLDSGIWKDRNWRTTPADLDEQKATVTASLPEGTKVYYFNLIDRRGLVISSEHQVTQ